MNRRKWHYIILLMLLSMGQEAAEASGRGAKDTLTMNRVFRYQDNAVIDSLCFSMNIYMRYHLKTVKKNVTLMTVPSMYVLARGKHDEYAGESYMKFKFRDINDFEILRQVSVGTVPRNKNTLPTLLEMLTPNLYSPTLMSNYLLSPFNRHNRIIYRYGLTYLTDNRVEIVFRPRKYNTQTVSGKAIADATTGRIMKVEFTGEYDMIRFNVNAEMGQEGVEAFIPRRCDVQGTFKYLGNQINANYHTEYNLPITLPDSIVDSHDRALMDTLRPIPLPAHETAIYTLYDSIQLSKSKKVRKHHPLWRRVLWDAIGDNLVNRIKGNFGDNAQGSFRISPILNPLYLGYSHSKGLTYKLSLRGRYSFDERKELSLYSRLGYSFKQHQFYFQVPIRYTYDKSRNAYVEVEVGSGNRISNNSVVDKMKEEGRDSSEWSMTNLNYFKDMIFKIRANHDVSEKLSLGGGITFHRRSAVDYQVFKLAGRQSTYHTFAPMVEAQIRPWRWHGPVFTINYEQGIKGIGNSDMNYGRLETDILWLRRFHRMRSLSMRFGAGVYTMKDKDSYFLDFENFRDNNLPRGWNDDWTGDFHILKRDMYNASEYYLRANVTYESPLMLMANVPIVGKVIETERIYVSPLLAKNLTPYVEWGYGFTNRLFSIGLFVATNKTKYYGFGCRMGLELFRDW